MPCRTDKEHRRHIPLQQDGAVQPLDKPLRKLAKQASLSLPVVTPTSNGQLSRIDISDLPEVEKLKSLAGEIRQHTLNHLDQYLKQMRQTLSDRNGHFHLCANARDARRLVEKVLGLQKCRSFSREPSAVLDEIELPGQRLDGGDATITGGNFAIAETGHICICRPTMPATSSRIMICVIGIEAILPRLADLAVMLKLLTRHGTGRAMPVSTQLVAPREHRALHVIFLDNGRSGVLAGEHRPVLRCIQCGACGEVCPVYEQVGRHAGGLKIGPVDAIMSPLLRGLKTFDTLPFASSLCGACSAVCPVGIDLPSHLTRLRDQMVVKGSTGFLDRLSHRRRTRQLRSPRKFAVAIKAGIFVDTPEPASKSFRELWKKRD